MTGTDAMTHSMLRRCGLALLSTTLALACALPLGAAAQGFPDKPIRLVIPYAAGGTTDVMARVLQETLQKMLGQPLIVDNRPGAGGALAARDVIHSKPDGYTLFFVNNGNLAVVPLVQKDANYDGIKDFTPVALVSSAPMVAVVPASLPVDDLKGFVAYAKKNPVSYASAGVGSFGQLATELLASRAGLKMTHIPYKGQGPTTTALIAGEVQLLVTTPSGAMNDFIAQKRLKLLAVTSPEPSALEPGTPTIAQTIGLSSSRIRLTMRRLTIGSWTSPSSSTSPPGRSLIALTSPPTLKYLPAPVSRTAWTDMSSARSSQIERSSRIRRWLMALRASGRLRVTVASLSATSTFRSW